ncbi:MAG: hypothetical protein JO192_04435 [Candidatus Eremiobacteraeota bacterium]|nr:hypothetical protein [Candidatus Eremiobacteraeota bacterium]MBV8424539.1 hypothetical protein [Candidatus Eremiobacteraeota bacterium]MBV8722554.1 hypothetical protein [Candidatus Eremiobacteraeota bacterium]
MVRRFFVSAFSSAVALAASALYPVAAAESQETPMPNGTPSFPEPDPIVVDQATADRARRLLDAVATGTFDRSELAPQLNAFVPPEAFVRATTLLSALGSPQSMFAFEKRVLASQVETYFRVRYPKETLTWVVALDDANRIVGLSLGRSWNNRIFSVFYRDIRYY